MRYSNFIETYLPLFNDRLIQRLEADQQGSSVEEAMLYSIKNGGKRFRPLLLLGVLETTDTPLEKGYPAALALEMIHSYSLIHDDLPAMDDDDLRRGQPSNHIVFGEGTAILAGDALLTKAFEVLNEGDLDPEVKVQLNLQLAKAAGHEGMIGGQQADLEGEERSDLTLEDLKSIHYRKTGALIEFAFTAAGLIADLPGEMQTLLSAFARKLGLAFQIRDDILDEISDEESLGKPVRSDQEANKTTYVSLLTLEGAKESLRETLNELRDLAQKMQDRQPEWDVEFYSSIADQLSID